MLGGLTFRLGPIPVRVHFVFLLTVLLFGASGNDLRAGLIWAFVVFFSVLAHELGHALSGMAFGLAPQIDIHGMGGTTSWRRTNTTRRDELSPAKRIAISIAGPFVGFVIGGIAVAATLAFGMPAGPLANQFVSDLVWVNLVWGAFNLLPMLPLDGGQVMEAVFSAVTGGKGQRAALYVSVAVGVCAAVLAVVFRQKFGMFGALLAAVFVAQNVRAIMVAREVVDETPLEQALTDGFTAIDRGEGRRAIALAETVISGATTTEVRRRGIQLLARGRLLEGHWASLMQLLESVSSELGVTELSRFEQAARELDRPDEAARIREWLR
jgi:Zn-dependent protease